MRIKVGDMVVVMVGKDKYTIDKKGNKTRTVGQVIKAFPKENKIIVKGVNIVKKHERATSGEGSGGIFEVEAPIDVSNVMMLDPKENVPTRIGYKIVDGKKVRYAKVSGEILD
ncbi:MAG: 50S ribosomal protein L24 [Acholeplasmataceae bacterium]|jgi:large subunit ribosomal protein L24|nr:50S ribosomal protein L24 [Acholeplasmataceae bacterium]